MTVNAAHIHVDRKIIGVVWLSIEMALVAGTVFGFNSIFQVLSRYGVYDSHCRSTTPINSTAFSERNCDEQTKKYQDAFTLGLIFSNLPMVVIGALIDLFGPRFVKLMAVIFHVVGWLALSFAKPGQDFLIFIHTVFTSLSGCSVVIAAYASSAYFSKSRALISTILTGTSAVSGIWFSIFQILINTNRISLRHLCYIWTSFGALLFVSSFLFLDWKFPILNLPYNFNTEHEGFSTDNQEPSQTNNVSSGIRVKKKWYQEICQRAGIWKHLSSPLYIMVVLFVSILLIATDLLAIMWYPRMYHLTHQDVSTANKYMNIFNFLILSGILICPIIGFLLDYKASQNKKRRVLNILVLQVITWIFGVIECVVCMFVSQTLIIPLLIVNCLKRSMTTAGPQAIVATYFPSKYIGTLTGIMWTMVGVITFAQYGLLPLTQYVPHSWKAWLVVLALIITMIFHLIQLRSIYVQEKINIRLETEELHVKRTDIKMGNDDKTNTEVSSGDTHNVEKLITRF